MNRSSLRWPVFWVVVGNLFSISAWAATIHVHVGANNQDIFSPNNFTAAAGDIIAFEFVTVISHSVVQSSFNNPCIRSGFDSGTHIANEGTGQPYVFNYTVADTSPVWLFCDVSTHCKEGMVAAINPPTSGDQTFAAFLAKAEGISTTLASTSTGSLNSTSTSVSSPLTTGNVTSSAPSSRITGTTTIPTTNTTNRGSTTTSSASSTSRSGAASRTIEMMGIADTGVGALVASLLMMVGAVATL